MSSSIPAAALAFNRDLEQEAPALAATLSDLGQRAFFPPDIPFQAEQARSTRYNGTIGVFTDGHGKAVPLPSMAEALELSAEDRNRALLYSPVSGIPEVREAWRAWQRREQPEHKPSSLPLVTIGLSHGLALAADLFAGPERRVLVPQPFWGNYRQCFGLRTGAELRPVPTYDDQLRFLPEAMGRAAAEEPAGRPLVVVLNFPSNPGGYSPTVEERQRIVSTLVAAAEQRPVVVICDDAYAGVVFGEGVPKHSMFWDLVDAHPRLAPVKVDGATKELAFFGGRVGFLTFAVSPESAAAAALESKVKCLVRAGLGSPVATSQMLVLQALRSGSLEQELGEIRRIAEQRYQAVRAALDGLDHSLLRPLPFNAGYFVVLEINPDLGLEPEAVRRHLIEHHDTGVVSIAPRFLRVALCSVEASALAEMMARVQRGVGELAAARAGS